MNGNAFDQKSLLEISNEQCLSDSSNYSSEELGKRPKKNYFGKALVFLACLGTAACMAYETFKPTIKGEVLGGSFSNEKVSELYIKNIETKNVDTLYFNTRVKDLYFTLSVNPEDYRGKAKELEEKLVPGTHIEARVNNYKKKNVHNIIPSNKDKQYAFNTNITSKF